jgi:glucose/arabinose dehydrogenase
LKTFSILVVLLAISVPSSAATLPPGFVLSEVTTGLSFPVAMAFAPDGRIFVTEQQSFPRAARALPR